MGPSWGRMCVCRPGAPRSLALSCARALLHCSPGQHLNSAGLRHPDLCSGAPLQDGAHPQAWTLVGLQTWEMGSEAAGTEAETVQFLVGLTAAAPAPPGPLAVRRLCSCLVVQQALPNQGSGQIQPPRTCHHPREPRLWRRRQPNPADGALGAQRGRLSGPPQHLEGLEAFWRLLP